jgi:hypothetical protein
LLDLAIELRRALPARVIVTREFDAAALGFRDRQLGVFVTARAFLLVVDALDLAIRRVAQEAAELAFCATLVVGRSGVSS